MNELLLSDLFDLSDLCDLGEAMATSHLKLIQYDMF